MKLRVILFHNVKKAFSLDNYNSKQFPTLFINFRRNHVAPACKLTSPCKLHTETIQVSTKVTILHFRFAYSERNSSRRGEWCRLFRIRAVFFQGAISDTIVSFNSPSNSFMTDGRFGSFWIYTSRTRRRRQEQVLLLQSKIL